MNFLSLISTLLVSIHLEGTESTVLLNITKNIDICLKILMCIFIPTLDVQYILPSSLPCQHWKLYSHFLFPLISLLLSLEVIFSRDMSQSISWYVFCMVSWVKSLVSIVPVWRLEETVAEPSWGKQQQSLEGLPSVGHQVVTVDP